MLLNLGLLQADLKTFISIHLLSLSIRSSRQHLARLVVFLKTVTFLTLMIRFGYSCQVYTRRYESPRPLAQRCVRGRLRNGRVGAELSRLDPTLRSHYVPSSVGRADRTVTHAETGARDDPTLGWAHSFMEVWKSYQII